MPQENSPRNEEEEKTVKIIGIFPPFRMRLRVLVDIFLARAVFEFIFKCLTSKNFFLPLLFQLDPKFPIFKGSIQESGKVDNLPDLESGIVSALKGVLCLGEVVNEAPILRS